MSSRSNRSRIAKQTVQIVERGDYTLPDGNRVSIAKAAHRAIEKTINYSPQDFAEVFEKRDTLLSNSTHAKPTQFRVLNTTTLSSARELSNDESCEKVLCLNFASAKNPGGGFLGGSQAQEESLARASALYVCINPKQTYYETNRTCHTCLYTDHMIYSPAVPVFRDDDDALLAMPYNVSILTSPAVNAGAVRRNEPGNVAKIGQVMLGRMEKVLSLALFHGYKQLVLGAWGCGVFQNDPTSVAQWFYHYLGERGLMNGVFDTVVFAVLDNTRDRKIIHPFQQTFASLAEPQRTP